MERKELTLKMTGAIPAGSSDADQVNVFSNRDDGGLSVHPVEIADFL